MKTEIRTPTGVEVLKDNFDATPGGKTFRRMLRKNGRIQSPGGGTQKTKEIGRQLPLSDRALRRQKAKEKQHQGTLFGTAPLRNRGGYSSVTGSRA